MSRKRKIEQTDKGNSILWNVLESISSEEELYEAYCKRDFWSLEEFATLMNGITPKRYRELLNEKNTKVSKQDFRKIKNIHKIYRSILKEIKKNTPKNIKIMEGELYWSSWRFMKWLGEKQMPLKKTFFCSLTVQLMELYLYEFQPVNMILKTLPQWHRKYHETVYIKHAQDVVKTRKSPMTFEQIYQHPHMEYVRMTFKDQNGAKVVYKKSTFIKGWLPKAFPKNRGRPKKSIS